MARTEDNKLEIEPKNHLTGATRMNKKIDKNETKNIPSNTEVLLERSQKDNVGRKITDKITTLGVKEEVDGEFHLHYRYVDPEKNRPLPESLLLQKYDLDAGWVISDLLTYRKISCAQN